MRFVAIVHITGSTHIDPLFRRS
jgi:hypothetical protein